jgi:multiple sugar transport system permease protein
MARSLLIIPWAIPEVVACLVWILMYDKDYGIINHILRNIGLLKVNIGYLQDPSVALSAAMAVNIWKGFPFVAIMLLAGFQSISKEQYEAADIDGANAWQKLLRITIPGIKPVSKVVFLLLVIWTVKDYAIAFCLAHGGPSRATEILTIYIQQTAFKYFDFGKASAAGIIMLIFSIIFTFFYFKIVDRGENQ